MGSDGAIRVPELNPTDLADACIHLLATFTFFPVGSYLQGLWSGRKKPIQLTIRKMILIVVQQEKN